MDLIKNVNAQVAQQNGNVATQTAEQQAQAALDKKLPNATGDKKLPSIFKKEETEAATEAAAPDAKAARRTKLDALGVLAKQTRDSFAEGQAARRAREEAENRVRTHQEEATKARQELEQAVKDPLGWLESKGVKMRALAERVAKGETPNDAIKALTEKILAMEQENERARQQWLERENSAKKIQAYERAKSEMVALFEKGKDKFATLHAGIDGPEELVHEFLTVARQIKEDPRTKDYDYSDEEILEAVEAKWAKRLKKVGGSVQSSTTTEEGGSTTKKPTLSTTGASGNDSMPADFKKLSPKKQIEVMTDMYKKHKKA